MKLLRHLLLLSVVCLTYINTVSAMGHYINGKLYFFEDNPKNVNYTWQGAIDFCHNKGVGYELVSIETLEENTAIKEVIAANYNGFNYWLGAYKEADVWFWRNGYTVSNWDWIPGEPSNNPGEDYLMMFSENGVDIGWQDSTINNEHSQRALCEAY